MATINEDYVSFETAKLLNKKGFDTPVWTRYENDDNKVIFGDKYNWNNSPMEQISAPTLQMAMKWLREVHKLYINIWADPKDVERNDFDIIFRAQVYNGESNYGTYEFHTYEQACEISIKYCLENLI